MSFRAPYLAPAPAAPMTAPLAARLATALTNPLAAFLVNGAAKARTSPTAPPLCRYVIIGRRRLLTSLPMTRCVYSVAHTGRIAGHGGTTVVFIDGGDGVGGRDACDATPRGRLLLIL